MSRITRRLPAIPLPGLRPDSLGNYLASLGLLRVLSSTWPEVRIAWKGEVLNVIGGPQKLDELLDALVAIASRREWTPYDRRWTKLQDESRKRNSGRPLAEWQSQLEEEHLEMFAAHLVARDRVHFNHLLGTGGNAGRRAFSDGWKKAADELNKAATKNPHRARTEIWAFLMGEPCSWLVENLNAASWFSDANKLYNSGQKPSREGLISPWAMALACEGLPFFAGSPSRRLGSRARAAGAFPFVTQAAAPTSSGEAGRDLGEVWAPLWDRLMTLPEVRALFARGRAEVQGRGAVTPAAFATAIVERGVDAGITGFLRFSLGRTTSANTFEPRFEGRIWLPSLGVPRSAEDELSSLAKTLERILGLLDRLPRDRREGKRWKFVGLRGPIERALIHLAARPNDPEAACSLLDSVVDALDRLDRNQGHRSREVSWEPLPMEWLPALLGSCAPPREACLALAVVSGFAADRPFALYRFGVELEKNRYVHPARAPLRWVWGSGDLSRVLADVLARRVLDWGNDPNKSCFGGTPGRLLVPASCESVAAWLSDQIDESLLERWLSRLALFDWRSVPESVLRLGERGKPGPVVNGAMALFGLFRPLFDLQPVYERRSGMNLLPPESGARTPAAARRLIALLRTGQFDAAVAYAMSRYSMANSRLVKTNTPWSVENPDRLLASLLITIPLTERTTLLQRWFRPQRRKGEHSND